MQATGSNGLHDPSSRLYRILMFPDSHDGPPRLRQSLIGVRVPGTVRLEFGRPPFAVGAWQAAM